MEYQIKPLSSETISDLKILYKAVFGNTYTEKQILEKYDTDYLGEKYFGHIAYYKNEPVAFHGAIPIQMKHNNQLELAAQYGDAMTLKNHTGKGLFSKLGKLTDAQLQAEGIKFVWGFPNQNSEYGYIHKLNWKYKECMKGFRFQIRTLPIEKIIKKTGILSNWYTKFIRQKFSKYEVTNRISGSVFLNENCVSVNRNQEYYRYKSFGNNFSIKINDTLFWIKIHHGLLIGDVEISTIENFDSALEKLKQVACSVGVTEIIFQASPNTVLAELLQSKTNIQFESWKVGYKNFNSDFPLESLKFTFGDLDTF